MSAERREILVTGATGLVGGRLLPVLLQEGYAVRAVSRSPAQAAVKLPAGVDVLGWDGTELPREALAGAEAVVHLAGEPLFAAPLTSGRRERIRQSRIDSTRELVAALGALPDAERPRTLVCASAVGYYGDRGEEILEEDSPPGTGFLAELCLDWEREAQAAASHGVRVVTPRLGIVLAREGGALATMLPVFRLGLGGRLGDGRQWFPWIHADDLARLLLAILRDPAVAGAVNAVAPRPVRNVELTRSLARALGRPAWFRVPGWILRTFLGELADEILGSRRVLPRAAEDAGFRFERPNLEGALARELG